MRALLNLALAILQACHFPPLLHLCFVVFTAGALGISCGEDSDIPSGCEDALRPRAEFPACSGSACEQVRREPDRAARWTITIERFRESDGQQIELSAEQFVHQQDCVTRQLHRLGHDVEMQAWPPSV